MKKEFLSNNENDTYKIAKDFCSSLKQGDIILLKGDLGAGKTAFVKNCISALGGDQKNVTSPTFTIVNEYEVGGKMFYHFDLYRIKSVDELYNIGIEEYFYNNAICFVEWPERAEEIFPLNCVKIEIIKTGENSRKFIIERG